MKKLRKETPIALKLLFVGLSIGAWAIAQQTTDIVDDAILIAHEYGHGGGDYILEFETDSGFALGSSRTWGGAMGEALASAGLFIPNPITVGFAFVSAARVVQEPYPDHEGDKLKKDFYPLGPIFYGLAPFMPFVTILLYLLPKALRPRIIWRIWQLLKNVQAAQERRNASAAKAKSIRITNDRYTKQGVARVARTSTGRF